MCHQPYSSIACRRERGDYNTFLPEADLTTLADLFKAGDVSINLAPFLPVSTEQCGCACTVHGVDGKAEMATAAEGGKASNLPHNAWNLIVDGRLGKEGGRKERANEAKAGAGGNQLCLVRLLRQEEDLS